MRNEFERDSEGRYPGAPAWNGDLRTVSPAGLDEHDDGLVQHIANVTVRYESWNDSTPWRVATASERNTNRMEHWVRRLVECRTERDRREQEIGVSQYLQLLCSPGADLRWPDKGRAEHWTAPPCTSHTLPKTRRRSAL